MRIYQRRDPWGFQGTRLGFPLGWTMLAAGLLIVAFMFEEILRPDLGISDFQITLIGILLLGSLLSLAPGAASFAVLTLRRELSLASSATNVAFLSAYLMTLSIFLARWSAITSHGYTGF